MSRAFICYSTTDQAFAHRLAVELKKQGIDAWIDEVQLRAGDSLIHTIGSALSQSDYVLAVISRASNQSEWVRRELGVALTREFREKKVVVLPLLLDTYELPPFLSDKLYVDFFHHRDDRLFAIALDRVLRVLAPGQHRSLLEEEIETPDGRFNAAVAIHEIGKRFGLDGISLDQKQALIDKMTEAY